MNQLTARSAYPGDKLFSLALLIASMAIGLCCNAQTTAPLSFEVATVKPIDPKNPHPPSVMISGDRFEARGMTLNELIKIAYDLNYGADRQVSGGPAWTTSTRFDVEAREDPARGEKLPRRSGGSNCARCCGDFWPSASSSRCTTRAASFPSTNW
jgi:hypothetical protein